MSGWDGAGSFTRVYDWTDDRDGGVKILASRFDSENDTFAAGIQAALAKNGENAATANLNLGGFRFTNAGNATAATDLARVSQVQGSAFVSASAGGTADALTASLSPAITAYAEGPIYAITPASNNATATPTLNINSIGATTIVKYGSAALVADDIVADEPAFFNYNSTDDNFNLLNPATAQNFVASAITASSTDTLTNKTIKSSGTGNAIDVDSVVSILVFDDSTNCATGDGAGDLFYRIPSTLNGYDLIEVAASCQTAGTTGTMDIQVHNVTQTADMLSTKITIDSAETDSSTAATPAVIDTSNDDVATGDQIRIDVDAVHTTPAKGLLVELTFRLP